MKLLRNIALLVTLLSATSLGSANADENQTKIKRFFKRVTQDYPEVPVLKVEELHESDTVVDVRERNEWEVSHLPNAIHWEDFEKSLKNAEARSRLEKKKIVAYCTAGLRSAKFIRKWKSKGLKIYNLEESIIGWTHRKKPVYTPDGKTTQKVHTYSRGWNWIAPEYQATW